MHPLVRGVLAGCLPRSCCADTVVPAWRAKGSSVACCDTSWHLPALWIRSCRDGAYYCLAVQQGPGDMRKRGGSHRKRATTPLPRT